MEHILKSYKNRWWNDFNPSRVDLADAKRAPATTRTGRRQRDRGLRAQGGRFGRGPVPEARTHLRHVTLAQPRSASGRLRDLRREVEPGRAAADGGERGAAAPGSSGSSAKAARPADVWDGYEAEEAPAGRRAGESAGTPLAAEAWGLHFFRAPVYEGSRREKWQERRGREEVRNNRLVRAVRRPERGEGVRGAEKGGCGQFRAVLRNG